MNIQNKTKEIKPRICIFQNNQGGILRDTTKEGSAYFKTYFNQNKGALNAYFVALNAYFKTTKEGF